MEGVHKKVNTVPEQINPKPNQTVIEKKCKICGRDYTNLGLKQIKNHERSHFGEKCPYCSKFFGYNGRLLDHISSKHPEHRSKYSLNNYY